MERPLYAQWESEPTDKERRYREGLFGVNDKIIFYYDTFRYKTVNEGNVLYKGDLSLFPDLSFDEVELIDENTAKAYATTFNDCGNEVYFKINDEKKSLDFIKKAPLDCDR